MPPARGLLRAARWRLQVNVPRARRPRSAARGDPSIALLLPRGGHIYRRNSNHWEWMCRAAGLGIVGGTIMVIADSWGSASLSPGRRGGGRPFLHPTTTADALGCRCSSFGNDGAPAVSRGGGRRRRRWGGEAGPRPPPRAAAIRRQQPFICLALAFQKCLPPPCPPLTHLFHDRAAMTACVEAAGSCHF